MDVQTASRGELIQLIGELSKQIAELLALSALLEKRIEELEGNPPEQKPRKQRA